jgi:hypothetical protein
MPRHDAADADIQMLPLFYAAWLPLPPLIRLTPFLSRRFTPPFRRRGLLFSRFDFIAILFSHAFFSAAAPPPLCFAGFSRRCRFFSRRYFRR